MVKLCADITVSAGASWDAAIKWKRKKHLPIMKVSDQDKKTTEMKNEISQALQGIQITDLRLTNGGNIIMNFENENIRNRQLRN